MITIKQPVDSRECVVACLAMVVGISFNDCKYELQEIAKSNQISLFDASKIDLYLVSIFLAKHNLLLGFSANFYPGLNINYKSQKSSISIKFLLDDHDGLLTIETNGPQKHLVVWDSKKQVIRDPHWNVPLTCTLNEKIIIQWYPIIKKNKSGWF